MSAFEANNVAELPQAEVREMDKNDSSATRPFIARPNTAQPSRRVVSGPVWADLLTYRKQRGESQDEFWSHFGVTQSAGSRYEKDSRQVPTSVHMLVIALALGMISEEELSRLRKASSNTEVM